MPETLLEVKKDVGADSCSNSRTKEKHSQLALDDGNPLTVQSESISVGVCVWKGGGQLESQGRAGYYTRKEDFESSLHSDAM